MNTNYSNLIDTNIKNTKAQINPLDSTNTNKINNVKNEPKSNSENSSSFNSKNGYDERIDKLIDKVNEKFKIVNREFSYSLHEKTNRFIVEVKNSETGDVIKEIPSEESLDLFAKMLEMAGLLIDEKS